MANSNPHDDTSQRDDKDSMSMADQAQGAQSQPDPKRMQNAPLRTEQPAQGNDRGSPNVHMDEGHAEDDAATQGERPQFDR